MNDPPENVELKVVDLTSLDSPRPKRQWQESTAAGDIDSPLLNALKMDKAKSNPAVPESDFKIGLIEAEDYDLLQNPLADMEDDNLLDSNYESLLQVQV